MRRLLAMIAVLATASWAHAEESEAAPAEPAAVAVDSEAGVEFLPDLPADEGAEAAAAPAEPSDPAATAAEEPPSTAAAPVEEVPVEQVPVVEPAPVKAADASAPAAPVGEAPPTAAPVAESGEAPSPSAPPEEEPEVASAEDDAPGAQPADPAKPKVKKEKAAAAAAANLLGPSSGIQLTFSWSLMAGLQTNPDFPHDPNASGDYTNASTSVSVNANYRLTPKIIVAGSFSPNLDLTSMPAGNRRLEFLPLSNFVRLNFRNVYKEEVTGIVFGGNMTYFLPVGYDDWMTGNPRLGAVGTNLQLFRTVGPVMLVFTGGLQQLPLFLNARPEVQCDPEEVKKRGASCPNFTHTGFFNNRFTLAAALTGIFSTGPWSVFAQVATQRGTTYGYSPDTQSIPNLYAHTNVRFSYLSFAQVNYAFNEHLSVNGGIFNALPQINSREGYNNPFFDPRFAAVFFGVDWVK